MRRRVLLASSIGLATLAAAVGQAAGGAEDPEVLGPGQVTVEVRIGHSRFVPDRLVVARGTTVRFEVRNGDPIAHELIVGDATVHARHERGREPAHGPVPGEVSVAPLSTASTTFTFDRTGTVRFACHLPGHLAYGMVGTVEVRDPG